MPSRENTTIFSSPVANSVLCLAGTAEPIGALGYHETMNPLLLIIILILLFGGGGFYLGGPVYGGSGLGLILLICLIVYLMGGFRTRR
jgi:hypothetical protein